MEFNEKLQELRKQKGITQEELAKKLYVSRTAVSKWELGNGYPNIDSLKTIAKFFSVTIDQLLSSDEILTIVEEEGKKKEGAFKDLVFGLLDVCVILFLFLPLFAKRNGEVVLSVPLLALDSVQPYLLVIYYVFIISTMLFGGATLFLIGCRARLWLKSKAIISIMLGVILAVLFVISLQPYVAVFVLTLLVIKVLLTIKR